MDRCLLQVHGPMLPKFVRATCPVRRSAWHCRGPMPRTMLLSTRRGRTSWTGLGKPKGNRAVKTAEGFSGSCLCERGEAAGGRP